MLRVKPPWSASVRQLDERDRQAALAICDRDPVTNVFVSSRVRALGLEPGRLGAQVWGHAPGGRLEWAKHVLDYGGRTGGGIQIPVADLDGDGRLDFVVAGKSGLFLFENKTR